jgi:hypothetical protein
MQILLKKGLEAIAAEGRKRDLRIQSRETMRIMPGKENNYGKIYSRI